MSSAREHIEDIKRRLLETDKDVLDSLSGAVDRLQKAFPRYGSFIMEFIQNADDAKSESLKIELSNNLFRISNDGDPFETENIKSICKIGRSSKTPKDYIGYLGVGFKSVFLISDSPTIYSGDYRFKFDKSAWAEPHHIPWQIIPLWIDEPRAALDDKFRAVFDIPLKETKMLDMLTAEVTDEHLNNRIILFLRHIREIEINDSVRKYERKIIKDKLEETDGYAVYRVREFENSILKEEDYWLIIRSDSTVPEIVKNDYVTKEWERQDIDVREVLVAFRLSAEKDIVIEREGTAHIGVFSFLPLKEIPSGLNFLIQADFLTNPGRGDLSRECIWNKWLAEAIYQLIESKCVKLFLANEMWKMNFTQILYPSEGGHELFESSIKVPLRKYLETNAVLITDDGSVATPQELVWLGEEVKELLSSYDIAILFPGKKVIHQKCSPHQRLSVDRGPSDSLDLINAQRCEELFLFKAKEQDTSWFKKLYVSIYEKYQLSYFRKHYQYNVEHDRFWHQLTEKNIQYILTDDYQLARPSECYLNTKKIRLSEGIKKHFKIVNPELLKDGQCKAFIDKLATIKELTDDEIKNVVKRSEAIGLDEEKWSALSELERIESTKHVKELWKKGKKYINIENYHFLTIKSKDGKWLSPENLILSKEYSPEHEIEALFSEGLIDKPLNFVNVMYLENANGDDVRSWVNFFKAIGVDKLVDKQKKDGGRLEDFVQRISVLFSLRHERNINRHPRELGESEKPGYDLVSEADGQEWFIEVKGSSKHTSFDIFLTVNELKALQNNAERYSIYAVTNALSSPKLDILRGEALLELIKSEVKITIPYSSWQKHIDPQS